MSKYSIEHAEHPLDFCRPDYGSRPVKPLVVSLVLDPAEGTLSIDFRREIDPTPMRIWHGTVSRFPIASSVNAVHLTGDINTGAFDDLFDRIVAGHSAVWDGHNWVGRLTQDAEDAEEDLCERIEEYEIVAFGGLQDASDWLWSTRHEIGITPTSTDAELQAIASKLEGEALNENVRLYGTLEALEYFRQELIDAQDGEDA